jgi:hypothetical protein
LPDCDVPFAGSGDQPTVDRLDFGVDDLIDATRDDVDLSAPSSGRRRSAR